MIVGEFPGSTEDVKGRPFVGEAGDFLRETLDRIGVDLDEDCLTTNALICRPEHGKPQKDVWVDYCRPNILRTIREFKPRIVILLGKNAVASVMHKYWKRDVGTMERWAGWKIPVECHWICPTYHPFHVLREREKGNKILERMFYDHLESAFEIKTSPPRQLDYRKEVEILYDEREAYEAIRSMDARGGWAAFDYETNCLKPEYPKAQIVSCSISMDCKTIAYPWWGKARLATGMFLKSKRTRKIASNMKMEERWTFKEFGYGVENWGWDTMIAAHCMDNRSGITGLKFQSLVLLGVPSYDAHITPYLESDVGHYNRIKEIELSELLLYNGMDSVLERDVAKVQRAQMGFKND